MEIVFLFGFLYTWATMFAYGIYIHRSLCHNYVTFHPLVARWFEFILWVLHTIPEVRVLMRHKEHHMFSDTEKDPHSPWTKGMANLLLFWPSKKFISIIKGMVFSPLSKYDTENIPKQYERYASSFMYRYPHIGQILFLLSNMFFFGIIEGMIVFILSLFAAMLYTYTVGQGLVHIVGYRNFNLKDKSRNIFPIGLLLVGEELHNNHHKFANRLNYKQKWYEVDFGYLFIKLLENIKLCRIEVSK